MFLEDEKEVVEAEEEKEEETKEETKAEETKSESNGGTKYHIIRENFNKALKFAIIGLAIETIAWILVAIFGTVIDNNVHNILNCVVEAAACAGLVFVGIVELKLFMAETNPKRTEDLASFIISLVAFILAFLSAFWFAIDSIQSLVWFFQGL